MRIKLICGLLLCFVALFGLRAMDSSAAVFPNEPNAGSKEPEPKSVGAQMPACIKCYKAPDGCEECMITVGFTGGFGCRTYGCGTCRTTGSCDSRRPPPAPMRATYDADLIRQIATVNVRIAIALIELGRDADSGNTDFTYYFSSTTMTPADVEMWLGDQNDPAYLTRQKQLSDEGRAANLANQPRGEYQFKFTSDEVNEILTVKVIHRANGDPTEPQYQKLSITRNSQINSVTSWGWTGGQP